MTDIETDGTTTIRKEIFIHAPAETIFAALTEPDQLKQWWGAEGAYRTTQMDRDLRVGGAWRTTGIGETGESFGVEGIYRVIEPPHVLEYTWNPSWEDALRETVVRFELSDHGGGTRLRVTHSGFSDMPALEQHTQGWDQVLAWLSSYVAKSP